MSTLLHKNFTDGQVKSFFEKHSRKEIKLNYILQILKIKRSRFFELLTKYRKGSYNFSIHYERKIINRKIDADIEKNFDFSRYICYSTRNLIFVASLFS